MSKDQPVTIGMNIRMDPGSLIRIRPSKAKLRKQLKHPDKSKRQEAWRFLQYRREHGLR